MSSVLFRPRGKPNDFNHFPAARSCFPSDSQKMLKGASPKPKVAAQYLLDTFRVAGIRKTYLIIREGKWDIPNYFRDGNRIGMSLAYIVISGSLGPPDTLDRAYSFVAQNRIAFGFPDIMFSPANAYVRLIRRQEKTGADIVLGLHRIRNPHAWDMVDTDEDGRVRKIVMKPKVTSLTLGWHFAVWTPVFSEFMHRFLRSEETQRDLNRLKSTNNDPGGDLAVGVVFKAALKSGLSIQSVKFPGEFSLDIGTPENLAKAVRLFQTR